MSERIQIKLNGRRFEFARDVALENLIFMKEFFAPETTEDQRKQKCEAVNCTHEYKEADKLDVFTFPNTLPHALPDYFGLIQVALRKNRDPAVEWKELNRKEQESIVWIVNTFKIEKFREKFGTVTATEDEIQVPKEQQEQAAEGDNMAEKLAKAHMKIAEAKDEIATREKEKENQKEDTKAEEEQEDKRKVVYISSIHDDEDEDNLILTGKGCFLCGVATHDEAECPYKKIGADMAEEAKRMVAAEEKKDDDNNEEKKG